MHARDWQKMIDRLKEKGKHDHTDGDIVNEYHAHCKEIEAEKEAEKKALADAEKAKQAAEAAKAAAAEKALELTRLKNEKPVKVGIFRRSKP